MDFIERWFSISPDRGSGSLEIVMIIGVVIVLTAPFLGRKIRSGARRVPAMNAR